MSSSMAQTRTAIKLAVIPGDGIGPEVTSEALRALEAALVAHDVKVDATEYDLGARRWHATGETLPDSVLEELRGHDAILLGAVGDPGVPSGVLERGPAAEAAVRPRPPRQPATRPRSTRECTSPLGDKEIDFVVVREGTEGPYVGNGGVVRAGHAARDRDRGQRQHGVRRRARRPRRLRPRAVRPRKHLTLVHKTNVLVQRRRPVGAHLRRGRRRSSPTSRPTICTSTRRRSSWSPQPERFDVIVTDNLFGDILTDLAAAVTGGIGLAASGNLDVSGTNPSMFEPVHGSAPDIAGQGHRRPDRGHPVGGAAARTSRATTTRPLASRRRWPTTWRRTARATSGGPRGTREVGDAICARL